jgi:enoyl-CoA hydratase
MMMEDVIKIDRRDSIAILSLNRPNSLNALTQDLARTISDSLIDLDRDDDVNGIVLTGVGDRSFCAGVDLDEALNVKVEEIESWFGTVCNIYRQILLTDKPVIAALNGVAAGGGFQMALVSDQRVAHNQTKMGQPEINAGIPSIMGSYWMSLHLGWSKNQELSMTGRLLGAQEATELGLINHLVGKNQLLSKACAVAEEFSRKPPNAWKRTKHRFREIALAGFEEAFRAGVLGQQEAYAKGEPQKIMSAFLEKKSG